MIKGKLAEILRVTIRDLAKTEYQNIELISSKVA